MSYVRKDHKQRKIRCISGRVSVSGGVPSVAAGGGFTLVDSGAGLVDIVLDQPGRVLVSAIAVPIEATTTTAHMAKVISGDESSVQFGIFAADATDGVLVDNVGLSLIHI